VEILRTIGEIRALLNPARAAGKTIGVMGTSGRVHEGHLSLARRAVAENDIAIVFWLGDLAFSWAGGAKLPGLYDRDWTTDRPLIEATGVEYVYLPDGDDYMGRPPVTVTLVPQLSSGAPQMEDVAHLDEVSTATAKLYNIFGKMRYYSGEKDWQQLAMFKRMAEDLSTEVEVVGCEVVREADGLALSSRNVRLTAEERERAPALFAALLAGRQAVEHGEVSAQKVVEILRDRMSEAGEVVYVHAVGAESLQPMETLTGDVRLIASLKIGLVPLVDNVGATVRRGS
jgi:pantoate--beta-alanine ligase